MLSPPSQMIKHPLYNAFGAISAVLLLLTSGCGTSFPQRGFPPPEDPVPALMPPMPSPDPEKLQNVAYRHYGRGDYVRALGFAYDAHRAAPKNPRYPVLLGLIYDRGLDRPDLAVLEYRKLLEMAPSEKFADDLRNRIQHLSRISHQRWARQRVFQEAGQADKPPAYAAFPLMPVGPRAPAEGLALGITDMLLNDLSGLSEVFSADPLLIHIAHHEFSRHRPEAGAAEFARWMGATRTLTGTLMDLGDRRIRVVLQVLGPDGATLYEAPSVTAGLRDLQTLRGTLSGQAAIGLELSPQAGFPPSPFSNPVNLLVHANALVLYLDGDVPGAIRTLESLGRFEEDSNLMARTRDWAARDALGADSLPALLAAYKSLGTVPDPLDAVHRRLMATHTLTAPPPSSQTGSESQGPYKPTAPPEVLP